MTVSQAYGLYRAGYLEAHAFAGLCAGAGVTVRDGRLTALERVILEFALHDLTNGTPVRSYERFERAVQGGAALLASLGLDVRPDAAGAHRISQAA